MRLIAGTLIAALLATSAVAQPPATAPTPAPAPQADPGVALGFGFSAQAWVERSRSVNRQFHPRSEAQADNVRPNSPSPAPISRISSDAHSRSSSNRGIHIRNGRSNRVTRLIRFNQS